MKVFAPLDGRLHDMRATSEMSSSLRKAVRIDEDSPNDKHIASLLDHATGSRAASTLCSLITSVSIVYRSPKRTMQSYAHAATPTNSVHGKSSSVHWRQELEGLQVVKALYLVHRIIEDYPEHIPMSNGAYSLWMCQLTTETEHKDRRIGYSSLVLKYVAYIQMRLNTLAVNSDRNASHPTDTTLSGSEQVYPALVALQLDLKSRLAKEDQQRVIRLALKTVMAELDMIEPRTAT